LSRQELAAKAKTSYQTIRDIEEKNRKPSIDMLNSLASALGIPLASLLKEEALPEPVQLPVSRILQDLMNIPDSVYKAAKGIPKTDPVWKMIEKALEVASEETIKATENLKNR